MTLQKIKSIQGKDEYVLLPIAVYRVLKDQIENELAACQANQGDEQTYEPFVLEDYVDNPVALARTRAGITQEQLAQRLGVSQAYVSQIERRNNITSKMLERVHAAISETT
ncbi:helix-turn-helix transcriptional regulator [Nitrosomonas sp. Is35]|uniref:helix-turn-helix domain-containing protein n=1 Tax=Nitrosomonas sp. Is35 TaxID=3080534 RepID=UPI00294B5A0B|nr:helix-turn-helix transcriptional regulator [Nitrosomonas sp. Is35]MDV6348053.1 helix-turn-helix transcriptional regulator [Nitrosomonas sp. Is35]